jgi:hypothetical protein
LFTKKLNLIYLLLYIYIKYLLEEKTEQDVEEQNIEECGKFKPLISNLSDVITDKAANILKVLQVVMKS